MKNDVELEKLLKEWFESNKNEIINNPHFWRRNKIGIIIKENLNAFGKWKYKRRGNPEKGWAELQEKKELNDKMNF